MNKKKAGFRPAPLKFLEFQALFLPGEFLNHPGFPCGEERRIFLDTHDFGDIDTALGIHDDGMKRHEQRVFLGPPLVAPAGYQFTVRVEDSDSGRHKFGYIYCLVFIDEGAGREI